MTFTRTPTLLSLNEWAIIMDISPWRFNQIYADPGALPGTVQSDCGVWFQNAWQDKGKLAREDVANAIKEAEALLAHAVGYWPAWEFIINEDVRPSRPYDRTLQGTNCNQLLSLRWGHFLSGGVETYEAIALNQALVMSDPDGDGYNEVWTLTCTAGGVTNTWELGAYFEATGRLNEDISQEWRMRPVRVTLDTVADTVTFQGWTWQLTLPTLSIAPTVEPIDAADAAAFVTHVDIYRRYIDTSTVGTGYYTPHTGPTLDPLPFVPHYGSCNSCSCAETSVDVTSLVTKDTKGSRVVPCYNGNTSCACSNVPDRFLVHYVAGLVPTSAGDIDEKAWKEAIAYLAAALLADRKCCSCDEGNTLLSYMRSDRAAFDEDSARRLVTMREAAAGFGTREGALRAWQFVNQTGRRLGRAAVASGV